MKLLGTIVFGETVLARKMYCISKIRLFSFLYQDKERHSRGAHILWRNERLLGNKKRSRGQESQMYVLLRGFLPYFLECSPGHSSPLFSSSPRSLPNCHVLREALPDQPIQNRLLATPNTLILFAFFITRISLDLAIVRVLNWLYWFSPPLQ